MQQLLVLAKADHLSFVEHDNLVACWMVLTRWAMMSTAASCVSLARALRSAASVLKSRAEKLSSKMYSSGFLTRARAMERRCFWPPEKLVPHCATKEFKPSGSERIKSPAWATSAACISCSSVASALP